MEIEYSSQFCYPAPIIAGGDRLFKICTTLVLLLLLNSMQVHSQIDSTKKTDFPIKDGKVVYENIEQVNNLKQANIYAASKKWIVDYFTSAKAVIQTDDKDAGSIVGIAYTDLPQSNMWATMVSMKIKFSFQISCKDEKYRIRLYNLNISSSKSMNGEDLIPFERIVDTNNTLKMKLKRKEKYDTVVKEFNEKFYQLMDSLSESIKKTNDDF